MSRRRKNSPRNRVRRAFNRATLKTVCELHELDFGDRYPDLAKWMVPSRDYDNYFYYADRGSDILFVGHLDTVVSHENRMASFAETKAGPVIHAGSLDDRLGVYIGMELLPALGLNFDVLLTVGEESGRSTAEFFVPGPEGPTQKEYRWMIEFDRKEDDVVMYCYTDFDTSELVRASGTRVGHGSFSDIAELEHLGIKGFNWGTGYTGNYHSVKGYAYLEDTYMMVARFLRFHAQNANRTLPHEKKKWGNFRSNGSGGYGGYGGAGVGGGRGSASTPRSSRGRIWVAGSGWVEKEEVVKVNGKTYASYEDWWNEAHPDEKVDATGKSVKGDAEEPDCVQCQGPWGLDSACLHCCWWDGTPRPRTRPGPLRRNQDREPVGVDDTLDGLAHPWDADALNDIYESGAWG